MKFKKTARQLLRDIWIPAFGAVCALLALFALYIYRITDLLPGFSTSERVAIAGAKSAATIMDNPLYAPHKVLQYVFTRLDHTGFIAMRGVSIVIALAVISLFFFTVRRWFSFRVAALSTVLFASSSWMLHIARLATPDIMMLSIMAAIAYGAWLPRTKKHKTAVALGFALVIWLLYIPGLVWFVLIGGLWQRKTILRVLKNEKAVFAVIIVGLLAVLGPILYAVYNDPALLKAYLGLSISPLSQIIEVPKRLLLIPVKLAILNSPPNPVYGIGRLPLLDVFTVGMVVLGIYNYYVNDRLLDRSKLLLGGIALASGLYALGGQVGIQILMPFVFLLVASGIAFMLGQWFKVFPSNPFAAVLAGVLLVAAVVTVISYNINSYFVAWPSMPATRAAFDQKPPRQQ
jgi:hypothetical protein